MQDIKELQKILYEKAAQENSLDAGILKLAWVVYKRTYVEAFIAGFKAGQSGNINEWMTILKEWPEDVTENHKAEMQALVTFW